MAFDAEQLKDALQRFERHLESIRMKPAPRKLRMRGATQFARFLLGRPPEFREVTKGRPL